MTRETINSAAFNELLSAGLIKKHHDSAAWGYLSRKHPEQQPAAVYHGKFGDGFTRRQPRWDTTGYHTIEYYITDDLNKCFTLLEKEGFYK